MYTHRQGTGKETGQLDDEERQRLAGNRLCVPGIKRKDQVKTTCDRVSVIPLSWSIPAESNVESDRPEIINITSIRSLKMNDS